MEIPWTNQRRNGATLERYNEALNFPIIPLIGTCGLSGNGIIKSDIIEQAMLSIDRSNYSKHQPFMDAPQSIGYGVTISAPHMHAHALELLKDQLVHGTRALDVGSGSGYLTACMAKVMGSKGYVIQRLRQTFFIGVLVHR